METTYLLDNYVATKTGEPYRLFAFGRIVKNGKVREITPEYAAQFKLPHFKPAIKLGSHEETTPAGGHIIGLEVRADGLYAVPEWNEKGDSSMRDGAYRYHSPEVLWDGGAMEDPKTGDMISGPLVLGDALLHAPHLGEDAKFYTVEIQGEKTMEENTVSVPKSFWDSFVAPLFVKPEPKVIEKLPEDYEITKQERDEYKAKLNEQAETLARNSRIEKFTAELIETKADPSLAELLADLPEEKSEAVLKQFKALSAQIDESKITAEVGSEGGEAPSDPKAAFNAAVLAIVNEKKINYNAAFEQVKVAQADLFKEAFAK